MEDNLIINSQKLTYVSAYPEITIAARYAAATAERLKIFSYEKKNRLKQVTANELETLARKIIG